MTLEFSDLRDGLDMAAMSSTPYADAIAAHAARDSIRLMVPGHAADVQAAPTLASFFGERTLQLDLPQLITGIDKGIDNPLQRSLDMAARAWGARRTWFMTNGASQANRVACIALGAFRRPSDPVVAQRSMHSSFTDGAVIAGLSPRFVQPSIDAVMGIHHGVTADALRDRLDSVESPKAVFVVSPSYFGAVADVAGLAEVAHEREVPLIVDGAWGPHFGFHPDLPGNPLDLGADLLISSTHKLGGSLTQSAMLHLAEGRFADELEPLIARANLMAQSTSCSALLLASLDIARDRLEKGSDGIGASIALADELRARIRAGGRFGIVSDGFGSFCDIVATDPLRVSIDVSVAGLNGHAVHEALLADHGIYLEISTDRCVVALVAPGVAVDIDRVVAALHSFAPGGDAPEPPALRLPEPGSLAMLPRDAYFAAAQTVPIAEAIGRVATESLAAYPPGIPNVLPGEVITAEVVAFLQAVSASPGGYVRGASDPDLTTLRVVADHPRQ